MKYLKAANFNISNIGYDDKDNVTFQHKTKDADGNAHTYDLPVECESRGTIRTLDIAKYVQDVVANNSVIAIDEIESSLPPKLVEHIIETFLQESTHTQLLVTTHYDVKNLMGYKCFISPRLFENNSIAKIDKRVEELLQEDAFVICVFDAAATERALKIYIPNYDKGWKFIETRSGFGI
ncbi:MAG: AAA family ATPase [Rikenellaceae bacterium]